MAHGKVIRDIRFDMQLSTSNFRFGDCLNGVLLVTTDSGNHCLDFINLNTGAIWTSGGQIGYELAAPGGPSLGPCAWVNPEAVLVTADQSNTCFYLSTNNELDFRGTYTINTDTFLHSAVNASTSSQPVIQGQAYRPNGIARNSAAGSGGQVAWISKYPGQYAVFDYGTSSATPVVTVCTGPSGGFYTSKQPTAVIAVPGTGGSGTRTSSVDYYQNCLWYMGFSDGTIAVVASSGEYVEDFSVTDGFAIDTLVASSDNAYMYATTFGGNLFTFNVGTKSVINVLSLGTAGTTWSVENPVTLGISEQVNGLLAVWQGVAANFGIVSVFKIGSAGQLCCIDQLTINGVNNIMQCGISAEASALWVLCDSGRLMVYDLPAAVTNSSVDTRTQISGVDSAARIIRIPTLGGIGSSFVESDTAVGSGTTSLPASHEEVDYFELSLTGTPFSGGEKIDVRVFEA